MLIFALTRGRVESSSQMTPLERRALLEEFGAKGFRPAPARDARAKRAPASDPVSRKIRACWLDLKNAGALDDASESALVAFCRRMTGKDALQFLSVNDANRVIESLKQWHARIVAKASNETPG
jgi:phage gp16-like protein